ncbi:hypothetical protein EZS27_016126 [termite gut metagenome]|uniref:Uncharacterized protein n=1 Tax=termite gut metagenome TaxID=433724 RepID=A0A5J4RRK0_9ZZZZ
MCTLWGTMGVEWGDCKKQSADIIKYQHFTKYCNKKFGGRMGRLLQVHAF